MVYFKIWILDFLPPRPSTPKSSLPWHPLRVSCFHNRIFPSVSPIYKWRNTFETSSFPTIAMHCIILTTFFPLQIPFLLSKVGSGSQRSTCNRVLHSWQQPRPWRLLCSRWVCFFFPDVLISRCWLVIDRSGYRLDSPVQDLASSLA